MSRVPGPTRRRVLSALGLVMVVASGVVLAYVGWQVYGTTWVATRQQREVVEATRRAWAEPAPTSRRGAGPADPSDEQVRALVRIPALGASYVVPAYDGTTDDVLARGFGTFAGAPEPGGRGNLALAGHRITHGEPLRDMPRLEAGDTVVVETRESVFTYRLDTAGDERSLPMEATWVTASDPLDPATGRSMSDELGSRRLITLVTCSELFHTDERLVAFGHLVDRAPRKTATAPTADGHRDSARDPAEG